MKGINIKKSIFSRNDIKNIFTANGTATLEFAREIMLCLNIKPTDKINEWYKFHKLGNYQL